MFKLTYTRKDGFPVRLVFDKMSEAYHWGDEYLFTEEATEYFVEKV